MNKETYANKVKDMIQNKSSSLVCFICGEDNPLILRKAEKHHILGKVNSDETILVCPNCHAKMTAEQNKLSPELRSSKSSRKNHFAYLLLSIGNLLKLSGDVLIREARKRFENGKISN